MTVKEFCLHKTDVGELVVVKDQGWIRATVWIDHEDLFVIHGDIANLKVTREAWETLPITDQYGNKTRIPCHSLYCE